MAFHNTACFSSILVICLIILTTTTNGTPLNEICEGTVDPVLCREILGGDGTASLEGLAEVGFQTAGIDSISNKNVFNKIANKPSSGSLFKEVARQCEQMYDHIFKDLIAPGHEAARVGRWGDVKAPINQIPGVVDECEKLWADVSPAHNDSRKVKVAAQAIVFAAEIKTQ